ncbi:hypothetical protein BDZ97DRAFT_1804166 [Flammula alnicola]|nr:hypothetical protein BDZ97DRAFT_1804166 [Flammula alnicola]
MSLRKIPVILLLTAGFNTMLTPPYRPPPKDEAISSTPIDIPRLRKYRLTFARAGQILMAAAEIATISANTTSPSDISHKLLSAIVPKGGHPSKISLSSLGILGAALWICGAILRMQTFQKLGRFFRFDISIQKNHELVVTGPYAYVRHPSYTGMLMANIGWLLWNSAEGSWVRECGIWSTTAGKIALIAYTVIGILPTSAVTLSRMSKEDEALQKQFGAQWDDWAKKVPYSIIPGIY